jgi:DNA gyrase/topoisomerase IV subunit A
VSHFLLNDIDEDTVDFRQNYDGDETEGLWLLSLKDHTMQ